MGRLSLDAIVSRDYMVFMGILAVTSVLGLLGRLLSDACYLWIDPRIQFD
jgi:microcin C transport system permease protein